MNYNFINIIIFFLFYLKYVNLYVLGSHKFIKIPSTNNSIKNIREGMDERFPKNNSEDTLLLQNIKNYHYKYNLLSKLQSNDTNEILKLKLIEDEFRSNEIKPFNILSGGLFNDFIASID